MANVTLEVQGMSCQHCVNAVEEALHGIGAEGKVDLSAGTVNVTYDEGRVTLDAIKNAIEDQGYDVA